MKSSKSEPAKRIVPTDDKRIFFTTINFPSEVSISQAHNKPRESVQKSPSKELENLEKEPSYEYKIGNYLIQQTLGEGTFGKVKLGIYLPNDEKVAIKVLEKDRMTDKDDQIRVKREFDMLSKFNHPNVILVTEIFESTDSYYSVMEFCEGGELFNYIVKKRRLTEKETAFFYFQIINGLEYIHSLGIVHRDLKPENLLLTKDHLLKIIDFGLSNYFVENQTELLSTPCGSPCYASPEMVAGKKYNGIKIDIWSTGIILFAMLCGYLPFEDKNNDILFDKILECNLEFPEYLSEESKDLISKILVVDPEKRITIPQIKKHSFFIKGKQLFDDVFTIRPIDAPIENNNDNNEIEDKKEDINDENNKSNKNENENENTADDNNKINKNENVDIIDENNNNKKIKNENENVDIIENVKREEQENNNRNYKESKIESKVNAEIKDDLTENKENINIENFQNNENNIETIDNNNTNNNSNINTNNQIDINEKNIIKNNKGFILNKNESKKSKKDRSEEIKDNNNNSNIGNNININVKPKIINNSKNNKKTKELNNKFFQIVDKKNNHKKINITDNSPKNELSIKNNININGIIKKTNESNKRNKVNRIPIHKTPEIKNEKILKLKEKAKIEKNKKKLIIDTMAKDRNTIGSIASVGSSIVETFSQQTNINLSFEHSKRTYSHENTKDIIQNEQFGKNDIIVKISNNNINKNIHNINISDNIKENKATKNRENNNYLFNHFNYNNKNDKIRKKNPMKIKKNFKDTRTAKHYYNSDNIRRPIQEIDFNICKLIDTTIKKTYKEFLSKKKRPDNSKSKSKSKTKENHFYTNRTNILNNNYKNSNISNNKENSNISIDNNFINKKNYLKRMQNYKDLNTKDKSYNKNKDLSTIHNNNNNSKIRYQKLIIKPANLLNKTIENNSHIKTNKLQYNTLLNKNSVDKETNPANIQTEPNKVINKLTKNNKIKNIKTTPNLENKKFNNNIKNNTQQKPFRENIDLSFKKGKGKISQKLVKYNNPINQVLNISNKKEFETINNLVPNYRTNKPDLNIFTGNRGIQKKIVKPKNSHSHYKRDEIPNKISENASKSIEVKPDSEFYKPGKKYVSFIENSKNNNIKKERQSNINRNNNDNYIYHLKNNEKSQNHSNSRSKSKDRNINKNKENKKSNNEILLSTEQEIYNAKNKLLKMNKFRNICINTNERTIDSKSNIINNNRKNHIRTIKRITKLNSQRENLFKIQKNNTINNMSNKIKHIISHSSKINNNNNSYLLIDYNKYSNMRLTDIYKNNLKNKNKLKKVYLIEQVNKKRNNSNEVERNNKTKNKRILNNPAIFQKQAISFQNNDNSKLKINKIKK